MKFQLKPYVEYKESGAEWFGPIPSHWESIRLGSVLEERTENYQDGRVTQVISVLRDMGLFRMRKRVTLAINDQKRRMIELLNEQKRAITAGFPNVRLWPSGVEWLGNIAGALDDPAIERCSDRIRSRVIRF